MTTPTPRAPGPPQAPSSAAAREEAPWRRAARLAMGTAAALGLGRFAFGLLVPAMRTDLGWTLAQAGAVTTANGLGYLVGALVTAPVVRWLGETVAFRGGLAATALALAATGATGSYPVVLATRAIAGVTGAFVFIVGGVIASRAAAGARSAAPLGIYFSGAGMGIAVSGAAIPPLLGHDPARWPLAWAALAGGAAIATAVSWTAAKGGGRGTVSAGLNLRGIRRLWAAAAAYLLFAAGYIAYITFLSAYLAGQRAGIAEVAVTWTVLGLAAVVAPAVWTRPISDWPGGRALAVILAILGGSAALALVSASPVIVVGSAVAYGVTFLSVPATITALIRHAVEPAALTGVLAAFTVVFAAGQTAGPYLAGALADRLGAGATLVWTAALCLMGAALAATIRRPGGPGGRDGTPAA